MFERFTQGSIKSILLAQEDCRRMGHHAVDSEHLFLGIIAVETGLAARFLEARSLNLAIARQLVEQVKRPDTNPLTIEVPYTHSAAKAFEFSRQEAQSLNHSYVGTEHILPGLIQKKKENKDLSELWRVLKHQGLLDQTYDALILYVRTQSNLILALDKCANISPAELAWQVLKRLEVTEKIRPEVLKLIKAPVRSKKL